MTEENQDIGIYGASIGVKKDAGRWMEKVEEYRDQHDIFVQLFDPDYILGEEHLIWAYNKAIESFETDTNRAKHIEIETILWASGEYQIKDALQKLGLEDDSQSVVIMIDGPIKEFLNFMDWEKDDTLLEELLEKLYRFGLTEEEIESTDKPFDLIYEKMSTSIL